MFAGKTAINRHLRDQLCPMVGQFGQRPGAQRGLGYLIDIQTTRDGSGQFLQETPRSFAHSLGINFSSPVTNSSMSL